MGTLTPFQRLIEFEQLGNSPDSASTRAIREENSAWSTFEQVRRAVARNWKPIAGFTVLGLALGVGGALMQQNIYRAQTVVEMQFPNDDSLNNRQLDPKAEGGVPQAGPSLQTQLRLLESDGLLWTAGVKSGLLDLPEYAKLSRASKLDNIHGNLVAKLAGQTRIVEVSFEANDPAGSADFVNQLVQSYRELMQGRRLAATRQTVAFLEAQIAERKEKADAAQSRFRDYVKSHGMSSIERESLAKSRLRELQSVLAQAEAIRAQEQSAVEAAEKNTADAASENNDPEPLRTARLRLLELNSKRTALAQTLKPNPDRIKQVEREMAEADASLQRERSNLLNRLRSRLQAAHGREKLLRDQVARQSAVVAGQASNVAQHHALKLDFDHQRAAYDEALRKYQEANSSNGIFADNVLVLDTAHQPEKPVRPKKALTVALGLFGGLFVGLIVAFVRDARTKKIESQAKASASMGVPQLGIAPPAWIDAPKGEPRRLAAAESRGRYALWNYHHPGSAHAEAYRDILTSLMFASERAHDGHLRVVITSAHNGEGRTTAAVNLATGIAETGCRVLLIDGNRSRQALHEIFEAPDTSGFFQAIALRDGLTAPVFASDVGNLFVMPAGPFNNAMLDVASLRKVLEDLRETYDVILIDAPPVLGHADARWFSRVCHGAVLVHDPRISTARDAEAALARLRNDRIHVFGTVLNQWSESVEAPVRNPNVIPEIRIRLRITG